MKCLTFLHPFEIASFNVTFLHKMFVEGSLIHSNSVMELFTGHKKKSKKKQGLVKSDNVEISCDQTKVTCDKSKEINTLETVENGESPQGCESDIEIISKQTKSVEERTPADTVSVRKETVNL